MKAGSDALGMTLADSHVKTLLKEGTARAGTPPTGAEWRVSPEAIAAAKEKAEEYLKALGEAAARACGAAKRSTLKAEDVNAQPASSDMGGGSPPAFS
jgi:histone H3/H4